MISPDFALLRVTEVVRVLGPVMVKESKSRRSCKGRKFTGNTFVNSTFYRTIQH